MNTKQVLDQIFKDPKVQYQLTEFDGLGAHVEKILDIYPKTVTSGREIGKKKYFLKSFVPFSSGQSLINELRTAKLTAKPIPENASLDEDSAWDYFGDLKFDVILTNPPFAGEVKDRKQLVNYELAKAALRRAKNKQPKEERDVLFIERNLRFVSMDKVLSLLSNIRDYELKERRVGIYEALRDIIVRDLENA
jgi:hypothetical protein